MNRLVYEISVTFDNGNRDSITYTNSCYYVRDGFMYIVNNHPSAKGRDAMRFACSNFNIDTHGQFSCDGVAEAGFFDTSINIPISIGGIVKPGRCE